MPRPCGRPVRNRAQHKTGSADFGIELYGFFEYRTRILGHDAVIGGDESLAKTGEPLRAGTEQTDCIAIRHLGIAKPHRAEIDRRQQVPTGAVIGVLRQVPLRLGDEQGDIVSRIGEPRFERLVRQVRVAESQIKTEPDNRGNDRHDGGDQRMGSLLRGFRTRCAILTRRRKQPATDLGASIFSLLGIDEPLGTIALQFLELVAVDFDLTGVTCRRRHATAGEGHDQHGCNRRRQKR